MARPNYRLWDLVQSFSPAQAASLWVGEEPPEDTDCVAFLKPAIRQIGEWIMAETGTTDGVNRRNAKNRVTRDELVALAEKGGHQPEFLFPDKRNTKTVREDSVIATVAALLAQWPGGRTNWPSGKDLERAAQAIGVDVSDDTIRKVMNAAEELMTN